MSKNCTQSRSSVLWLRRLLEATLIFLLTFFFTCFASAVGFLLCVRMHVFSLCVQIAFKKFLLKHSDESRAASDPPSDGVLALISF